jgi:hypothetical protein
VPPAPQPQQPQQNGAPTDAPAGRPVPQPRVAAGPESQPHLEGPLRETREGVTLRLALEEEAS